MAAVRLPGLLLARAADVRLLAGRARRLGQRAPFQMGLRRAAQILRAFLDNLLGGAEARAVGAIVPKAQEDWKLHICIWHWGC